MLVSYFCCPNIQICPICYFMFGVEWQVRKTYHTALSFLSLFDQKDLITHFEAIGVQMVVIAFFLKVNSMLKEDFFSHSFRVYLELREGNVNGYKKFLLPCLIYNVEREIKDSRKRNGNQLSFLL